MAGRIRTVKPEWLEDEKMVMASPHARVLSIALILEADDYGNGRANEALMFARVFPGNPPKSPGPLAELESMGFLTLFEVRGQRYFSIHNWDKHQKVNKPGKPRVPALCEAEKVDSGNPPESPGELQKTPADHDHDHIPTTTTVEAGRLLALAAVTKLNTLTGRSFSPDAKPTMADAARLVKLGHTPEQAEQVVTAKVAEWLKDDHMAKQLKPSVLLRPSNFAKYLEEDVDTGSAPAKGPGGRVSKLNLVEL